MSPVTSPHKPTVRTTPRSAVPCNPPASVVILATGEHGTAVVRWSDGSYCVRLDTGDGIYCDATTDELQFTTLDAA